MRIVGINHLTLDGVMQAPGRADEDTRDGFEHGGWASTETSSPDPDVGEAMGPERPRATASSSAGNRGR